MQCLKFTLLLHYHSICFVRMLLKNWSSKTKGPTLSSRWSHSLNSWDLDSFSQQQCIVRRQVEYTLAFSTHFQAQAWSFLSPRPIFEGLLEYTLYYPGPLYRDGHYCTLSSVCSVLVTLVIEANLIESLANDLKVLFRLQVVKHNLTETKHFNLPN